MRIREWKLSTTMYTKKILNWMSINLNNQLVICDKLLIEQFFQQGELRVPKTFGIPFVHWTVEGLQFRPRHHRFFDVPVRLPEKNNIKLFRGHFFFKHTYVGCTMVILSRPQKGQSRAWSCSDFITWTNRAK